MSLVLSSCSVGGVEFLARERFGGGGKVGKDEGGGMFGCLEGGRGKKEVGERGGRNTFGCITGFILAEPGEVFVFEPGDVGGVVFVVFLAGPFRHF